MSEPQNLSDLGLYKFWQRKAETRCQDAGVYDDQPGRAKEDVLVFLKRIGIGRDRLDSLSVIHVTGTKGKGSTCTFVESILQTCGYKTGLLSSPSIIEMRERIHVGGTVLPRRKFAEYGLKVFQLLDETENNGGEETLFRYPNFIQYLTLLSMYIFLEEKVDVGIVEVFIGGEFDATNIFRSPCAVGMTTLEVEHSKMLGDTLESIAWHKSGLARKDRPMFTLMQQPGPLKVIADRTAQFGGILKICPPLVDDATQGCPIELGSVGKHQFMNASVAVQLARQWIQDHHQARFTFKDVPLTSEITNGTEGGATGDRIPRASPFILPDEFVRALKNTFFPGRCQTIRKNNVTVYCDVAHTIKSIAFCRDWFLSEAGKEREKLGGHVSRILMYSMTPKETMPDIMSEIVDVDFDAAAFSPSWVNYGERDESHPMLYKNKNFTRTIQDEVDNCHTARVTFEGVRKERSSANQKNLVVKEFPSISASLQWVLGGANDIPELLTLKTPKSEDPFKGGKHIQILVTGCAAIVGGVIKILDPSSVFGSETFVS